VNKEQEEREDQKKEREKSKDDGEYTKHVQLSQILNKMYK
jgi:hypothetical protein